MFWREIHFYWEKILVFTISLKQIFLGTIKFWGHKKIGENLPRITLGYGPACKANISHMDENIAALFFG